MNTVIDRWLRAANPFSAHRGMAEAQRAARVGAIGILLSLIVGSGAMVWMIMEPDRFNAALIVEYQRMGLTAEQLAMQQAVIDPLLPMLLWFGLVVSVLLYGALAWAQWRYMTRAIPLILLALAAYGVLMNVVMLVTGTTPPFGMAPPIQATGWVAEGITALLYVASLRGAVALHKLRQQA